MPPIKQTKCPRCGGPVFPDYDDDSGCLHCGELIYQDKGIKREQIEYWRSIIHSKRGRPRKVRPEEGSS